MFNKKVVGKNYGVFGKGAFPGVLISRVQHVSSMPMTSAGDCFGLEQLVNV